MKSHEGEKKKTDEYWKNVQVETERAYDEESKTKAMAATQEARATRAEFTSQIKELEKTIKTATAEKEKAEQDLAHTTGVLDKQKAIVKEQAQHAKTMYKNLETKHSALQDKLKSATSASDD